MIRLSIANDGTPLGPLFTVADVDLDVSAVETLVKQLEHALSVMQRSDGSAPVIDVVA